MNKFVVITSFLFLISLIGVGCSKKDNGAPANYNGVWNGSTSQGKTFSFTVSGNKVTSITINYTLSGNCSPSPTGAQLTLFSGNDVTGNSFTISGSTAISGTFTSANSATGTFSVNFTGNPPGCSSTASGTWSATK